MKQLDDKNPVYNIVKILPIILILVLSFLFFRNSGNKALAKTDEINAKMIANNTANAIERGYITKSITDQKLYVPSQIPAQTPDPSDIGSILAYYRVLPVGKIKNPSPKGSKYYIYYPRQNRRYNFYITCDVESGNVIVKIGKDKATAVEIASDNIIMWGNHNSK
ncbi:hypothetical protein [Pseudobacteroides cellulosolvens]|uniref:Uncharacterized protein n=1 Tax=Pseudobacteroides cellulosolvens ATCC 35603 = DSM 2933 TaxID=398512 RepID=A0A0L6JVA3_9FIRM|nr:hypothetical protein [Pseudobacteroides cellulosolvens]KNY29659.1 hypothetical protein Bccel_4933 [Pseudobacteroides cellulosolvens ATCC 35603 = DSM 2933]